MNEWLPKRLETIKNACAIAELAIEFKRYDLLPTILEYMYGTMQTIIDENCVEE